MLLKLELLPVGLLVQAGVLVKVELLVPVGLLVPLGLLLRPSGVQLRPVARLEKDLMGPQHRQKALESCTERLKRCQWSVLGLEPWM